MTLFLESWTESRIAKIICLMYLLLSHLMISLDNFVFSLPERRHSFYNRCVLKTWWVPKRSYKDSLDSNQTCVGSQAPDIPVMMYFLQTGGLFVQSSAIIIIFTSQISLCKVLIKATNNKIVQSFCMKINIIRNKAKVIFFLYEVFHNYKLAAYLFNRLW